MTVNRWRVLWSKLFVSYMVNRNWSNGDVGTWLCLQKKVVEWDGDYHFITLWEIKLK